MKEMKRLLSIMLLASEMMGSEAKGILLASESASIVFSDTRLARSAAGEFDVDGSLGVRDELHADTVHADALRLGATKPRPDCDATTRFTLWFAAGQVGVSDDQLLVCILRPTGEHTWVPMASSSL
jgi:hypothetical protein